MFRLFLNFSYFSLKFKVHNTHSQSKNNSGSLKISIHTYYWTKLYAVSSINRNSSCERFLALQMINFCPADDACPTLWPMGIDAQSGVFCTGSMNFGITFGMHELTDVLIRPLHTLLRSVMSNDGYRYSSVYACHCTHWIKVNNLYVLIFKPRFPFD